MMKRLVIAERFAAVSSVVVVAAAVFVQYETG